MSDPMIDLRKVATIYRDDLLDELARLDAFIDWADQMVKGDNPETKDLCVLTGSERNSALH